MFYALLLLISNQVQAQNTNEATQKVQAPPIVIEQKIEVTEAPKAAEVKAPEVKKEKGCCGGGGDQEESGSKATRVHGFLDAQFRFAPPQNLDATPSFVFGEHRNTFLINSGAFKFSHQEGRTHFHLDIPFYGDTTRGASASNSFFLAEEVAQAYVTHYYRPSFWWTVGQFDTAFGFEPNDADELLFTRQGLLYNTITPTTHTGIIFGYHHSEFTINLLVANYGQKGIQGAGDNVPSADKKEDFEYGLKVGWKNEQYHFKLAGLFSPSTGEYNDGVNDEDFETEQLLDVGLGGVFDKVSFDLNYNQLSNPDGVGKASGEDLDPVTGFLAQISYNVHKDCSHLHLRYEQVDDKVPDETLKKLALGFNHKSSASTTIKAEVAYNEVDDGSEEDSYVDGGLAVVYSF